jgi:hypothetical protein
MTADQPVNLKLELLCVCCLPAPSGQQILAETRGASLLNLLIFCVARGRIRDPSLDTLPPPSGLPRAVH